MKTLTALRIAAIGLSYLAVGVAGYFIGYSEALQHESKKAAVPTKSHPGSDWRPSTPEGSVKTFED